MTIRSPTADQRKWKRFKCSRLRIKCKSRNGKRCALRTIPHEEDSMSFIFLNVFKFTKIII